MLHYWTKTKASHPETRQKSRYIQQYFYRCKNCGYGTWAPSKPAKDELMSVNGEWKSCEGIILLVVIES